MVFAVEASVQRNGILNAMSNSDLALLQPHLEAVPLKFRQRLQSSNRSIRDVYFPDGGIASVVAVAGNERRQAEVAIIGREGMSGLAVIHGADRSPCDVFMQVEGAAPSHYRTEAAGGNRSKHHFAAMLASLCPRLQHTSPLYCLGQRARQYRRKTGCSRMSFSR